MTVNEPFTHGFYLLKNVLTHVVHIGRLDKDGYWFVLEEVPHRYSFDEIERLFGLGPEIDFEALFESAPQMPFNELYRGKGWIV